jgi:hypothetical protein
MTLVARAVVLEVQGRLLRPQLWPRRQSNEMQLASILQSRVLAMDETPIRAGRKAKRVSNRAGRKCMSEGA